jgi:hypothetical protein
MDHILHAAVVVAQVHSKKLLLLSCRHQEKTTRSDTTLCRVLYIPWTAAVADARVKIGKQNSIYIYIPDAPVFYIIITGVLHNKREKMCPVCY